MTIQYSLILAAMLFASELAFAQTESADAGPKPQLQDLGKKTDTDWMSYRDAYKAMIQFQKYGKPKQFIQNHFQVSLKSGQALPEDMQLNLVSKNMRLNLPLDAAGRANFPLLKSAYDENAELTVNQASGQVIFQSRISIIPRADGVYEMAELRNACEQAQAFLKSTGDATANGKACVGVRFSYPKSLAQPGIKWRGPDAQLHSLATQDGSAFQNEAGKAYKTATIKFSDGAGQILTPQTPLAIAPWFE